MNGLSKSIEHQLEHRTVREFTDQPIADDVVRSLMEVANRTATSNGMQSYSIIRITDAEKRAKIASICNQEYVKRVPELWIYVVDCFRNARIAEEMGVKKESSADMDRFFQGFTDACLAAQNVTNAVESMGYGAVYFGSILNDPEGMIEILELPKLTFPALGMGFGVPAEVPWQKPRMDLSLKVFENGYEVMPSYLDAIQEYDEVMSNYYDLREKGKRSDRFSTQVVKKLENSIEKRRKRLNAIRAQGFHLRVE